MSGLTAGKLIRASLFCAGLLLNISVAQAKNVALLIGVGEYQSESIRDLKGPPNDVAALKEVLVDKWNFKPENIHTLVNRQATKKAILSEIELLGQRSGAGDEVLVYFSGHGTSNRDISAGLPIPHDSGAIIPWDAVSKGKAKEVVDSLIVGRFDLVPRLKKIDQGGRNLVVLFDSCFSGNAVRGLKKKVLSAKASRYISKRYAPIEIEEDEEDLDKALISLDDIQKQKPEYPYSSTFFISAASDFEKADDISRSTKYLSTIDKKPHGAFTDALLRILAGRWSADANHDGMIEQYELREAVARRLAYNGHSHHPRALPGASDDTEKLAERPLFGIKNIQSVSKPEITDYRVKLRVEDNRLRQAISKMQGVVIVPEGIADMIISKEGARWILDNGAGDRLGVAATTDAVLGRVRQMAWFNRLTVRQAGLNPFRLALELADDSTGITLQKYDYVNFRIESGRDIWLVILYIDSNGDMAPLYPYLPEEKRKITARRAVTVPGPGLLQVCDPLGTDLVIAMGFTQRPDFLDELPGMDSLSEKSGLYRKLERAMNKIDEVAIATFELHTVPNLSPGKGCQ